MQKDYTWPDAGNEPTNVSAEEMEPEWNLTYGQLHEIWNYAMPLALLGG
jgi:hypothetical protein